MKSTAATADTKTPAPSPDVLDGEFVGRDEMADMLKISVRTLVRMTHQTGGVPHLTLGNRTLYRVASVRDWLAAREVKPGARPRKRRAA